MIPYFYLFHQNKALKNSWKMLFVSLEKLFFFQRYSNFCTFLIIIYVLEFHGEFYKIEFYNSIQKWAFTTVHWLQKTACKDAWLSIFVFIYICTHIYYSFTNETWNFPLFRRFTSFNIWILNFFNSFSCRKIIPLGLSVCVC